MRRAQQTRGALWVYGAADVLSGASYFRSFLRLCAPNLEAFVDDLYPDYPKDLHLMLLDNCSTHYAYTLQVPSTLRLHLRPPYSPELNPIERPWQHIKQQLTSLLPTSLGELQELLAPFIEALDATTLLALITPAWLLEAAVKAGFP